MGIRSSKIEVNFLLKNVLKRCDPKHDFFSLNTCSFFNKWDIWMKISGVVHLYMFFLLVNTDLLYIQKHLSQYVKTCQKITQKPGILYNKPCNFFNI